MADNLTAFTDALSSTTNRTVDGFGEIIQEISPARGTITSWYDGGGNLTKTVDADGIETDFTYDAANRPTGHEFARRHQRGLKRRLGRST